MISAATTEYTVDLEVNGAGESYWAQPYLTNNENDLTPLQSIRATKDGVFTVSIPALSMVSFVVSESAE